MPRNRNNVCHIAIATHDLGSAIDFYVNKLGCKLARQKEDRVTFNFFGDQLVCHLSPEDIDDEVRFYPRHFGITFFKKEDYEDLLSMLVSSDVEILGRHTRFNGMQDEHDTFFISDYSNNLVEFKYYKDPEMMY